jgi:hypothetical protein
MFCFELFLSGVDLKLGEVMASSSGDKEKTPPEDDTKDFWLKEEVESEDEEEDQSPRPNTMIASIGVVTDHDKFKKSARIRTLIYISYFIGPMYIHVSLSLLFLFLLPKTEKDQKYFRCFSLFVSLAFYLWFALLDIFGLVFERSKNILLCLHFLFVLVSKI